MALCKPSSVSTSKGGILKTHAQFRVLEGRIAHTQKKSPYKKFAQDVSWSNKQKFLGN